MTNESKTYGRAYAFFDCSASKEQIEAELPKIRNCIKTPSNLELTLTEGICKFLGKTVGRTNELLNNQGLIPLILEAEEAGMKYVLEAKYKDGTNKQTADEVASVVNQTYQTPLYADKEPFRGAIVYQDMGKYIFRE